MTLADRIAEIEERADAATQGPWWLANNRDDAQKLADMLGKTLADHEAYHRDNDGSWIVTSTEGGISHVNPQFEKQPKRGTAYCAPDPGGMASAAFIAAARSDVPALCAALKVACEELRDCTVSAQHAAALASIERIMQKGFYTDNEKV
jgi:hypothetical protein